MFVHQTKKKNIEITWLAKKVKQSIFSPHINIAAMQILNLISVPTLISENSAIAESVKSKKQTDGKKIRHGLISKNTREYSKREVFKTLALAMKTRR